MAAEPSPRASKTHATNSPRTAADTGEGKVDRGAGRSGCQLSDMGSIARLSWAQRFQAGRSLFAPTCVPDSAAGSARVHVFDDAQLHGAPSSAPGCGRRRLVVRACLLFEAHWTPVLSPRAPGEADEASAAALKGPQRLIIVALAGVRQGLAC